MYKHRLSPIFSISHKFGGGLLPTIPLITDNSYKRMNPIAQFDIDNTLVGHQEIILRIGSVVGVAGAHERFNLALGAADKGNTNDQFGTRCRKVQGFSELSSHIPITISEIHIISSDLTQLNRAFTHNIISIADSTITQKTSNIAFTQQKTDKNTSLNIAKGNWILSANQYFSYTIGDNITLTLLFRIKGINNITNFIVLQKV